MTAREVLAELDRLGLTIYYQPLGPDRQDPDARLQLDGGHERAHADLLFALDQRTSEILEVARFEPEKGAPGVYLRRPGGGA